MKININMRKEVPAEEVEVEEVSSVKKILLNMKRREIILLLI
jgi:hypothetical protein